MAYYPYNSYYPPIAPYLPQNGVQMPQGINTPMDNQKLLNGANNGFISVRTVEEARAYPVAPGNSITFKVENSPFLCTKTMGFSQLEQPQFEKYRLVKEEEMDESVIEYALKSDLEGMEKRIKEIESRLEGGV